MTLQPMRDLSIGDLAPDITLLNQDELPRTLSALRGRTVVLYFYPKDNTPGCTTEACDVRDALRAGDIPDGVIVFGISADSPSSHRRFREKLELPFDLLSDEDHTALNAYGVWTEKKLYGRTSMGIERSTFVIAPDGRIAQIWRKVKVPGHIREVLKSVA
jgi:peroxiredoxin Q/BCP